MIRLELRPKDAELLREILESYRSDLSAEIADTDMMDFREPLKVKKDLLTRLIGELELPKAAS